MASQEARTRVLLKARCSTFSAISLLSLLITGFAFYRAIGSPSFSTGSVTKALFYNITLPFASQLFLLFERLMDIFLRDKESKLTDQSIMLLCILMIYGWTVMSLFWTYCEIYKNNEVCALRADRQNPHNPIDTTLVVLAWMMVVVFIIHAGFPTWEVRKIIKAEQSAGKAVLLDQVHVETNKA